MVPSSLTPAEVAEILPSRPLLASAAGQWRHVALQLFRHPPACVAHPGTRDHALVLNMGGKALINDTSMGVRRQGWAEAGCFSLTPSGQSVRRSWAGRPEVLIVFLDPVLLRGIAEELDLDPARTHITPQVAVRDPVLHHHGSLLLSELRSVCPPSAGLDLGRRGSALMVASVSRSLGVHLLRHYSNLAAPVRTSHPALTSRRLGRVVDYMRDHLDHPVLLSDLARVCGLSATHFSRAFRDAAGKPPHAYLVELRVEKAKELLEHSRLPIGEIAVVCGFQQQQYFATVFRRKVGLTPGAWRIDRGL